jgi:hypothetical protein
VQVCAFQEDQKCQAEEELGAKLLSALENNGYREATPEFFEPLRARVCAQCSTDRLQ